MMRVFVDVAVGKMDLDEVERLLNPQKDEPRAYIKVMEAEYLILMDINMTELNLHMMIMPVRDSGETWWIR